MCCPRSGAARVTLAGVSENFTGNRDLFLLRGKTVYARVEPGQQGSA